MLKFFLIACLLLIAISPAELLDGDNKRNREVFSTFQLAGTNNKSLPATETILQPNYDGDELTSGSGDDSIEQPHSFILEPVTTSGTVHGDLGASAPLPIIPVHNRAGTTATLLEAIFQDNRQAALTLAKAMRKGDAGFNAKEPITLETPLHVAARKGWLQVVGILLDKDADPLQKSVAGRTPLLEAIEARQFETAILIASKLEAADNCQTPENLDTPLHLAAKWGVLELAKVLTDRKLANLTALNRAGRTPLMEAIVSNNVRVAEAISEGYSDWLSLDPDHLNEPLITAVTLDFLNLTTLLLEKDANVNAADALFQRTPLHEAVLNENVAMVRLLIGYGALVTAQDDHGRTPLQLAISCNEVAVQIVKVVSLTNEFGAALETANVFGETPLQTAVIVNCPKLAKLLLLDFDADCAKANTKGQTALDLARHLGFVRLVRLLANSGKCLNPGTQKIQPVGQCSDFPTVPDGEIVESFSAYNTGTLVCYHEHAVEGSDVVTCGSDGQWHLHGNCKASGELCGEVPAVANGTISEGSFDVGSKRTVSCHNGTVLQGSNTVTCTSERQWLISGICSEVEQCGEVPKLENGIISDGGSTVGSTRTASCLTGYSLENSRLVTCTRERTWQVLARCQKQATYMRELLYAASVGNVGAIEKLLKQNADVNAVRNDTGTTPLISAAIFGNTEAARILIDHGAKVEWKSNEGMTALMWASKFGKLKTMKLLLERGANIEAKANDGKTALIHSASNARVEAAGFLLGDGNDIKKADVDAKDNDGWTALMHAASKGDAKVVSLLISKEANVNNRGNDGTTALTLANRVQSTEAIRLLQHNGAKLTVS